MRSSLGGSYPHDPIRSLRNPKWKQDSAGVLLQPFNLTTRSFRLGYPLEHADHRIHLLSHYARWDRRVISRRSKPASLELTVLLLSQACRLGGLHRASTVPFRSSYFTSALHPADATLQRLIAYLYRLRSFPLISSSHFVTHTCPHPTQPIRPPGRRAQAHTM